MFTVVTPRKGVRTHSNYSVDSSFIVKLAAVNTNRKTITFQNQGSVTVFIGDATVANTGGTTGYALFSGQTFTDNASDGEWWAIAASSTANVHVIEVS